MGIIIVESDDNIGFIIKKNPSSGMIKRQIRNCEMSGFYKKGTANTYGSGRLRNLDHKCS